MALERKEEYGRGRKLPRRVAIFHCRRCPDAARKLVQRVDYIPQELICVRCGNRVKPELRVVAGED